MKNSCLDRSVFLLSFFILIFSICFCTIFHFAETDIFSPSVLFVYFRKFFVEYSIISLFSLFLCVDNKYFRSFIYVIIFSFLLVHVSQAVSYYMSGEFISKAVLQNVRHWRLILNPACIIPGVLLLLLCFIFSYIIEKFTYSSKKNTFVIFLILMGFGVFAQQSDAFFPRDVVENTGKVEKANNARVSSPSLALYETLFVDEGQEMNSMSFSASEMKILRKMGFVFNPQKEFPLIHSNFYRTPAPFKSTNINKKNVIVFFVEGWSARLASSYDQTFPKITPNIDKLAEKSIVFENYYNHTALTYRGIHGQLCSMYPYQRGIKGYKPKSKEDEKIEYFSLSDAFAGEGYETYFLTSQMANNTYLDDIVKELNFENVFAGDILGEKYLGGEAPRGNKSGSLYLTDKQFLRSLIGVMEERKGRDKPFFIGLYNFDTHPWIPPQSDWEEYEKGQEVVLNAFSTFDSAFGQFMKYFKNSSYAKNTVIILTADHARYFEKHYTDSLKEHGVNDYQRLLCDKIPLIIYDPTLPGEKVVIDAKQGTSLDFAPTLVHYLNFTNKKNPFMGRSLFEKDILDANVGIYFSERHCTYITRGHMYTDKISEKYKKMLDLANRFVRETQHLEIENRIWHRP